MMDLAMNELASHFPGILKPLVRERDAYLAYALLHVPGEVVVAVIGKGYVLFTFLPNYVLIFRHVEGIVTNWGKQVYIVAIISAKI
jgi:hypothetical protein